MAVTVLTTAHGNHAGVDPTRFNVVIQLGYDGTDATGYKMYVRYFVRVTVSYNTSPFTSNLNCSWTSTKYSLTGVGDYAISDWISLGTKAYGTTVKASANCYYQSYSGEVRKSSGEASYKIPVPTYSVSYNANGGSGAPSKQTKTHGTNLTLSSTKPTRAGHTFLGWGTSSTDTTIDYASGGTYKTNANITLYAIWQVHTYAVWYDANGGINAPSGQTKTYGVNLPLQTSIPTRTDYIFLGWNTYSTATEPLYQAGDIYTENAGVTLYAVWLLDYEKPRVINFTIERCDANGVSQEDGTYAKIKFNYDTDRDNTLYAVYYQKMGDSVNGGKQVVLGTTSGSVDSIVLDSSGNKAFFDTEYSYLIQLNVADSNGYTSQVRTLNSLFIPIDITPDGINMSFGEPAKDEDDGVLRFAYKTIDFAPKEKMLYHGEKFFGQKYLWGGSAIMDETHFIDLPKPISEMKNGILLVFGRNGDYNLTPFFIPKESVAIMPRTSYTIPLCTSLFDYVGQKTLYVSDTKIEGHTDNDATGKNAISGITYHNEAFYLRFVYEV